MHLKIPKKHQENKVKKILNFLKKVLTNKLKNVNISEYLATDIRQQIKTKELVIKFKQLEQNKTSITSFLFCPKTGKKTFLKKCRKSVDKTKKVQYNAKRSN